ncbi:tetratricopeptide repeat protein [Allomuricauda sp. SCSIO 65647]|uniref:tetratricopeptide repeat-containing sensor histidine kinase n=1 Tax=Allomuricauda sp. SCSIO 65647 TaxID=2908843 RepID=UPI001F246AC6|nr:tetratricopeptide repeat protein [Muricauda sp. SCSIO 65647]UJH68881.1 tetratricopeptide repeat protein [Muricauda sp. SCSIO 65647]
MSNKVSAQFIPTAFKKKVENLITVSPKEYAPIDNEFRREKRDTVLMAYLNQEAEKANYYEAQAYALNHIGRTLRNLSQFEKAEMYHKKALKISEEVNSIDFRVLSLNWLGVVYRRIDAVKTALDYNQEALRLAESVEDPSYHIKRSINVSLNCIGLLYQTLEQYDLAIKQFKEALKLEYELNNKLGLAINYQNIGHCYELEGDYDEALENYRKSLAFNEEINNNMGRIICKNSIAQIHLKQDMPNAALVLLEPLQEQSIQLGDNSITSSVFINLGWAEVKLGNFTEAEKHIEKGLDIAKQYNMPSIMVLAYKHLSELETMRGNYNAALQYFKQADELDKKITSGTNFRYMQDVISRYETEKKNNEIADLAKENELVRLRLRKNQTTFLVSALAIGLIASILYILHRKYQSQNEKRVLSLEQNMLRSQMNPHFLFNSLNSIKLYIINNDQKNAVHYLNKFSKLVRKILEASSSKEITLEEELETLELYMNIENIRFSNEIDFTINIDKNIDLGQIKIPSLALQPFLENALWHGLSPKDGKKKVSLDVAHKTNGHVTITIEDNGIGREAAHINKENRVLKRKSVGINITKERLANFAKDYQNSFEVQIIDLFDDSGKARGTKVEVEIPVI